MNPYKFTVCCVIMVALILSSACLHVTLFTIMLVCGDTRNPNLPCSKPLAASASLLCIKIPSCFQCFYGFTPDKLNTKNCRNFYLALIVVASFVVLVQPAVAKGVNTTPPNKFVLYWIITYNISPKKDGNAL